jgi:DUF1680 family protein
VAVDVSTDYPREGDVAVKVTQADGRPWSLTLRVPSWAGDAALTRPDGSRSPVEAGNVTVEWPFAVGDEITLSLPLVPRWSWPEPRIDAVRGCVAVERGPIVMCVESTDLPPGRHVDVVAVDTSVAPREVDGEVVVSGRLRDPIDATWPYGARGTVAAGADGDAEAIDVRMTAYHDWGNRGPSTMRVWIPTVAPGSDRP